MKKVILSLMLLGSMAGCSSSGTQKVKVEEPEFKVKEAAPGGRETWHDTPQAYADDKGWNIKEFYYYSAEGRSADKRMSCEKAQANLLDDISKQVATFVDTSIARATSESTQADTVQSTGQSQSSEETQRISSQLSRSMLGNIEIKKQYWELRDYSQGGGARSMYFCWVLGSAKKQDVNNMALKAATMKLQQSGEEKKEVEAKLGNIGAEYEKFQKTH